MNKELTQEVFNGQPKEVDWAGVDYDGMISFGMALNPRTTWASERWRGFQKIGEPIMNTEYKPLTMIYRECKDRVIPSYQDTNYNEVKHRCINGVSCNLCDSMCIDRGSRCDCVKQHYEELNKITNGKSK